MYTALQCCAAAIVIAIAIVIVIEIVRVRAAREAQRADRAAAHQELESVRDASATLRAVQRDGPADQHP